MMTEAPRIKVGVDKLELDPENPRLPPDIGKDQESILRYLVDEIGIDDVLSSIAESGFIAADPVIVKPSQTIGKYVVLEGNRRLAAILVLLRNKQFVESFPERAATLREITVETGWDEARLVTYLGYKHVTSAKEWGPEAKARFVIHKSDNLSDDSLRRFAKELGTKLNALKRWIIAYKAIEQARRAGELDDESLENRRIFGTIYTLMGGEQVREFLGLQAQSVTDEPVRNMPAFVEFLRWVIGEPGKSPVINSRDQQDLSRVLADSNALEYFRKHLDLKAALRYVESTNDEVALALKQASFHLDNVVSAIRRQKDDKKVRAAYDQLLSSVENVKLMFGDGGE